MPGAQWLCCCGGNDFHCCPDVLPTDMPQTVDIILAGITLCPELECYPLCCYGCPGPECPHCAPCAAGVIGFAKFTTDPNGSYTLQRANSCNYIARKQVGTIQLWGNLDLSLNCDVLVDEWPVCVEVTICSTFIDQSARFGSIEAHLMSPIIPPVRVFHYGVNWFFDPPATVDAWYELFCNGGIVQSELTACDLTLDGAATCFHAPWQYIKAGATGGQATLVTPGGPSANNDCQGEEFQYRQARLCSNDQLADVWLLDGFPHPSFELAGVCYYIDPDDPTSTTPGTVYGPADVNGFVDCETCIDNLTFRQARACDNDALVDVWMLSANAEALTTANEAFQIRAQHDRCYYFNLNDPQSPTHGTLYTITAVEVFTNCAECIADLPCPEPCEECDPCLFCPTPGKTVLTLDGFLQFFGCGTCGDDPFARCCVLPPDSNQCTPCINDEARVPTCHCADLSKEDCEAQGGTFCCADFEGSDSSCIRSHYTWNDVIIPLVAFNATTMTYEATVAGVFFQFIFHCNTGFWDLFVQDTNGGRDCRFDHVSANGTCAGFSVGSAGDCSDGTTDSDCACSWNFAGVVTTVPPCDNGNGLPGGQTPEK